jgi:hypothetical protein
MTCEEVPLVASYARKAFSSLKNAFRIAPENARSRVAQHTFRQPSSTVNVASKPFSPKEFAPIATCSSDPLRHSEVFSLS